MIAAITNFDKIEIDCDVVICGGVVKDSFSSSVARIREINKKRTQHNITTLLTKDEVLIFLMLKNILEYESQELDIYTEKERIDEFINYVSGFVHDEYTGELNNEDLNKKVLNLCVKQEYDTIRSFPQNDLNYCIKAAKYYSEKFNIMIAHFVQYFNEYTNLEEKYINDPDLYKMFSKILDCLSFCEETQSDFGFFSKTEQFKLDNEALNMIKKYPIIKDRIQEAYYFNKTIDSYLNIMINYFTNSYSKYELNGILFITNHMTCFQTMFCEHECEEEKNKKMVCLYESIKQDFKEEYSKLFSNYEYVVTYGDKSELKDNIYFISGYDIFFSDGKNCQIIFNK